VLYLSRFRPDPARSAEWLACLWQGPVPEDLQLRAYLYVDSGSGREMVIWWEGEAEARAWLDRVFTPFGELRTEVVTENTPGLGACLERDLDKFAAVLRSRGSGEQEIDRQLDVRRRGMHAESQEAAARAGREWAAEQPPA
jgi:hypothetical protein